jgi:nucleoside-diphosphate-sugar epimerase
MNYAITGNKGLIGESIKRRLDQGHNRCVLAIDKREGFDVMDLLFKEYEPTEKPDVFYHFAAQCRINEAIARPILPHKNNVDGILAVLEFCRKRRIPKVVVASSSRILSKERNPYTASKVYAEELTKAYHDCYGLEYIIVRPSTVYGPIFDETSRMISNFLVAAFRGEDLRVYGDKNKTLDFTYVDDFVDGVMLATQGKWNRTYNISGEKETKVVDVANEILSQIDTKSKVLFMPPETAQPQQVRVDTSAIRKLGYKPKVGIQEGIKRMVEFYRKFPEAWHDYQDKGRQYYR